MRPPMVADDPRRQDDVGEGDVQREDGHEGRRRDGPQDAVAQGPGADAPGGEDHDGGDRRLDPVEDARHHRHVAIGQIDPGQGDQDAERRQHEQDPGHDAPQGAVHQPADVGRELLGLGSRQDHGVVQGMEEAVLADPTPPLHQIRVHHGDLPRRAAEAHEAELEPVEEGLEQRDRRGWRLGCGLRVWGWRHGIPLGVGPGAGKGVRLDAGERKDFVYVRPDHRRPC